MGDMADWIIENGIDDCVYDLDLHDGFEMRSKRCKYCGKDGFVWINQGTKKSPRWRLMTKTGKLHSCAKYGNRKHEAK